MTRFARVLYSLVAIQSAAAFAPSASQNAGRSMALPMTTDSAAKDPVRVGVIGCGRIGIVHLGAINKAPGVIPVILSNPTISKAENGKYMMIAAVHVNNDNDIISCQHSLSTTHLSPPHHQFS